jgi:CheY-like chemotaxis protein
LLVEDDSVDVMTVRRALRDLNVSNQLVPAGDGEQALAYLRDRRTPRPCVILLDLNMPKMNGTEFLRTVKGDDALKMIPVIVLTTSNTEQDIARSFELGAAGYMVKSIDYDTFMDTIKAIDLYWTQSKLPPNGE